VDLDCAAGVLETGDDAEGSGLATSGRAEQGHHPAFPHVEAEVVQGHDLTERPGQVTGANGEVISR
jgi:hypothetical protein